MTTNPEDLEKFFAAMDVPEPDSERRKATLKLSVAAFEAQKSASSKNKSKKAQGLSWLSRLTSQNNNSERMDSMTKNKKLVFGGLMGGVAAACIVLALYPAMRGANVGEVALQQAGGNITVASNESGNNFDNIVDRMETPLSEQAQSAVSPPAEPAKGALPVPAEAESLAMASPQVAAPMAVQEGKFAAGGMASRAYKAEMPVADIAYAPVMDVEGRDKFSGVEQNSVKQVKAEPVSTFSIDVDTSSYSFVRQSLDQGILPQKDAVRVEEMINYFDYAYPGPQSKDEPFATNVVVKDSPWNAGKKLITIGIKGFDAEKTAQPDSNLVFLLDTSGSMNEPKKLPLLKQSFSMLLDSLKPTDKVSIVVYAGSAGTVLPPTEVSKKSEILQALSNLEAGGSTAGGEGIRQAYQLAQQNFNKDAVNRVILATDGDFNVGITEPSELKGFIEREREKGIFLSVLGFGTGNYNDALMQELAQNGNGVAAYIDTLNEARKVLVQEAAATLFPIAKDVKIQVEFNPKTVSEYRLVGYETRALKTEDFNNDKVDAGDIGAGAEVTAIYEVTPVGAATMIDQPRYDDKPPIDHPEHIETELAFVKVRYKLPSETKSKLITTPVHIDQQASDELIRETNWAEAVAGYGQLLTGGKFTGALTYDDVLKQAEANKGADPFGYRAEFITLVHKAKTAASLPAQGGGGGYEGEIYR